MELSAPHPEALDQPWRLEQISLPSGLNLRVARAGQGPLLLMLHGFPECWYSWRHQLVALAPRFTCVAPDLRGYGGSDAPRGVAKYRLEELVGDVVGLIERLGHGRATLIGHDWGGAIAWATALMHPECLERLIVLNCPHPLAFRRHLRSNPRQWRKSWYILFFQLPWLPERVLGRRGCAPLVALMRRSAVNRTAFSAADLAYFRQAFAHPYSLTAALNYYRALRRRDLAGGVSIRWLANKIALPTLLIWGEQDVALGKELTYGMEQYFTGRFELKYVPDSGHWVQQERPQRVNRLIEEFLA
ncbi:MAG TPA: alpha/beta hydrolase [Candidatus Binataceae bacterium]|nr:alpha/beta hydrolase [Candidatus Binataceae bacterium]